MFLFLTKHLIHIIPLVFFCSCQEEALDSMTEKLKMIYFAKHGSTFPLSGDVPLTCHQDYRIQCLELLILLTLCDFKDK